MPTPTTFQVRINTTDKSIEVKFNTFTVNQIYSFLMDQFDEQGYMDDLIPMNAKTPTLYELVNGWTFTPYSNDFLYNSAITETRNGTQSFNIWTNVRTLGAIESGSTLYIQQGTIVTYDAFYPFCNSLPLGTEGTEYGTLVTTSTIPTAIASSGSLWVGMGLATQERIGYSSWVNGVADTRGTFVLSTTPANTHPAVWPTTNEVVRVPLIGHFDILLITRENAADIDGTNFKTYCRQFQKTYSDFTTTGGAVVSNVPLASASDPFLSETRAQCVLWENTITMEWQASNIQRSAFDGTAAVQEYVLDSGMTDADTFAVVTNTIDFSAPASGYIQVEGEVIHYTAWRTGTSKGTFDIDTRGQFDTTAVAHLAGRDLSTAMFEYDKLIQSTNTNISLQQVYNFVQYELLVKYDIDDSSGAWHLGWITAPLVEYTGALWTKQGVWVEGFNPAQKSNIKYRDVTNLLHTPPTYITLKIDGGSALWGGRAALYQTEIAYNPAGYTIIATFLDNTVDVAGDLSTSIKYAGPYFLLARTRKAGLIPYELGTELTSAVDLTVVATNPEDSIYT